MSKPKLGKGAYDIFTKKPPIQDEKPIEQKDIEPEQATARDAQKVKQSRGRPLEHKEEWTKVTVVLLDKQIHWLDKLATEIRFNTKVAISRAEILRAMINAVEESGIDLSEIISEDDIKNKLLKNIKP
jgi:hypothetical protein